MPALREIFAKFGIEFDNRQLKAGEKQVDKTSASLSDLGGTADRTGVSLRDLGAIAGSIAAFGGLTALVQGTIESTRYLEQWSRRLHMSAADMQGWIYAGSRFGATADDVTDALKELQLKATDALTGGTAQAEMFQRIGLSLDDLRPVVGDATALMDRFVEALMSKNDVALQAFTVDELMSDAGTRLLPMFQEGATNIRQWRTQASTAARRDTPALTRAIRDLTEKQADLNLEWTRTKNALLLAVAPAASAALEKLEPILAWAREAIPKIAEVVRGSDLLKVTLIAAGSAAAVAWGPAAAEAGLALAPFLLLIAAADDLSVALRGGKSVLEELLIEFYGAEEATKKMRTLREVFQAIGVWLRDIEYRFRGFLGLVNNAARLVDPLQRAQAQRSYIAAESARVGLQRLIDRAKAAGATIAPALPFTRGWSESHRRQQEAARQRLLPAPSLTPAAVTTMGALRERERGQAIYEARMDLRDFNVSNPQTMNITINEAMDLDEEELGRTVQQYVQQTNEQNLREIRDTLAFQRSRR